MRNCRRYIINVLISKIKNAADCRLQWFNDNNKKNSYPRPGWFFLSLPELLTTGQHNFLKPDQQRFPFPNLSVLVVRVPAGHAPRQNGAVPDQKHWETVTGGRRVVAVVDTADVGRGRLVVVVGGRRVVAVVDTADVGRGRLVVVVVHWGNPVVLCCCCNCLMPFHSSASKCQHPNIRRFWYLLNWKWEINDK